MVSTIEDQIRAIVVSAVRAELATVLGAAGLVYSTVPGAWPPGKATRRAARDAIRLVPGAARTGAGKASVWSVSRDAYHAHYSRPASALRVVPALVADDDALAEEAFRSAGLRATRTTVCNVVSIHAAQPADPSAFGGCHSTRARNPMHRCSDCAAHIDAERSSR